MLRYAWKLLWPFGTLCYDHGHECLPTITTWHDPNNWAAFMLYTFMLLLGRHALAQPRQNALAAAAEVAVAEETAGAARSQSSSSPRLSRNTSNSSNGSICSGRLLLWGLALLVVPFVPASHVLFPIGTVLGERLLYLPSAGYALLLAHLVCVLLRCTATPQSQSASSFPDLPQKKAQIVEGTKEEKNMPASAHCRDMSPSHRLSKQQHRCCSSLVACASLMAIGGYGVALGNASWARNFDWATEIALFESAMNVCPRSLKVRRGFVSCSNPNPFAFFICCAFVCAIFVVSDLISLLFSFNLSPEFACLLPRTPYVFIYRIHLQRCSTIWPFDSWKAMHLNLKYVVTIVFIPGFSLKINAPNLFHFS